MSDENRDMMGKLNRENKRGSNHPRMALKATLVTTGVG